MSLQGTRQTTPFLRRGFSIIETMVYVALFSALSIVVVESIMNMTSAFGTLRMYRDINDTAIHAMERVTREIKWAGTVDVGQSVFASSSSGIFLNSTDSAGNPKTVEIVAENGDLRILENGVDTGSLVSGNTEVNAFVLYYITAGSTSIIKIELTLSNVLGREEVEKIFYNSAILRDSY